MSWWKIKVVAPDLDGTLLDSADNLIDSLNLLSKEQDKTLASKVYNLLL